jgi:hypothetical protein
MKIIYRIAKWPLFISALSALLLLNRCSYPHYYYSPSMQDVPLFTGKNQFSGTMTGSFGTVNPSLEMQAGFSLPGHVALMGGFMTGKSDNSDSGEDYEDYSKNNYFESGIGYYQSFAKKGVFEVYAGYGGGNQRHVFAYKEYLGSLEWQWIQDGNADISFSKMFIQPDIGIKTGAIEGAFSLRLSRLNFKDVEYSNTAYRQVELNDLIDNPTPWVIEPAFTFRVGSEAVKFHVQVMFAGNLSQPVLDFERFRFNLGVHFCISPKKTEPVQAEPIY